MAENKEQPETAKEEPVKKKKPIMMIGILLLLVAIFGGLIIAKQVSAKNKSSAKDSKPKPGPIMPLDDFLVNLTDPGGDHFLKVTVNLELMADKTPDALKDKVPIIRDAVLTALCNKSRDQIMPLPGRDALKQEIVKDVNSSLGETDVQNIYFSDFVTQ